jgi:hypothetical protein
VLFCFHDLLPYETNCCGKHQFILNLFPAALLFGAGFTPVSTSNGFLVGGFLGFLLLALELLRISPEEGVNHDIPSVSSLEGATEMENLSSQQPVHEGDGFLSSVVAWDSDIDVVEWRVGVTQSDARDVSVRGLLDGLMIGLGVSDDQETGLHELTSDLVSQHTWGPSLGNSLTASVVGELHDGSGTERSLRANDDVLRILNGNNNSGSNHELLPSLTEMDDVDVVSALSVDITLHLEVHILGTDLGLEGNRYKIHYNRYSHTLQMSIFSISSCFC